MSKNVSFDEYQLMSLYDEGNRTGLISNLMEARRYLSSDEKDEIAVTESCIRKLRAMTDAEYGELALSPDYFDYLDEFDEKEDTYAE